MAFAFILFLIVVGLLVFWYETGEERDRQKALAAHELATGQFQQLCEQLTTSPLDEHLYAKLLSLTKDNPSLAHAAYELALNTLTENPSSLVAKQFALTAGRKSYSAERSDNKPTIYDEQAIQNDIMIRTGSVVAPRQEPVAIQ